jgi:hypothetical protein
VPKRILLTCAAYLISLLLVSAISFFVVIILAGPHAGLLPAWLEMVVLFLGWLAVIVIPIMAAIRVWSMVKL